MSNPYDVLGVSHNATEDEIKAAYRGLAKKFHPDLNRDDPESEIRFKEVSAAYEQLTKPQANQGPQAHDFHFHFNGGEQDMGRAMWEHVQGMMRERERRAQNANLQTTQFITLEQAFTGCEIEITVQQKDDSPTYRVVIPRGIEHGQRIRVEGGGLHQNKNFISGDLFVIIGIQPSATFVRVGSDLVMNMEINSFEAILGKTISVKGIDGSDIEIKIPAGCQYGEHIRLVGHGMTNLRSDNRGDLIAEIAIRTPNPVTAAHEKMVNEISNLLKST